MKIEDLEKLTLENIVEGSDTDGDGNPVLIWELNCGRILFYTDAAGEVVKVIFEPY